MPRHRRRAGPVNRPRLCSLITGRACVPGSGLVISDYSWTGSLVTLLLPELATQMFVPSTASATGLLPTE